MTDAQLVLASASRSRARMLADAGVPVEIMPSRVDEEEIKRALIADGANADQIAEALAELKASRVSAKLPGVLVLGADSTLAVDDLMLDKPESMADARNHLLRLRGRSHRLISAACIALNGTRIWSAIDDAELTMRPLSDAYVADYLDRIGDAALQSVGCYQLEGLGAQLFSRISGDYFTILGLPLLPVLGFLRERGLLME